MSLRRMVIHTMESRKLYKIGLCSYNYKSRLWKKDVMDRKISLRVDRFWVPALKTQLQQYRSTY